MLAQQLVGVTMKGGHSLWWTGGSEKVPSMLFVAPGLPDPASFVGMLDFEHASDAGPVPVVFGLPHATAATESALEPGEE